MTIPASGPISFSQIRNELLLTGSVSVSQLISNNNPWSNIPAAEQAYAITDFVTPYDYDELAPITVDYDTHNDKILIAGNIYDDDNYGGYVHMLIIGSVSGTSISYTPIQIAGTDENFGNGYDSTVLYMPTNNKIVFLYNNYGTVVLKIGYLSSATAVTWNNTYNLGSGSSAGVSANLINHPTINNKFFVLYKRNNTTKIVPYTVDSSGAAVAGVTTTLSISYANKPAWAWDIQNDRLVLTYIDGANLKAQVGQFTAGASDSANTITFSAAISLSTSLTTGGEPNVDLVYASQEQVLVCSYSTDGVYPKTQVLTVDVGNNSILTGPVVTAAGSSAAPATNKLLYRADTNTLHQFYNVYHTSSVIRKFTAHRLAISTGAATERKIDFLTTVQGPTVGSQCGAVCLDPDSSKVVVVTSKSNGSQPSSAFLYDTQKPVSPTVFRNKSHYPLRNSATDPTSNDTASNNAYNWRLNSTPTGYTFIANKGIYSDVPITDMSYMFFYKSSFNDADIALWDVSTVTNMVQTFFSCGNFNQNIGNWNVSNVTNMSGMFYYCSSFNQNIGNWNVSNVTDMSSMFNGCSTFNADIGSWNPSSATNMTFMFDYCTAFNQNLNSWNTTSMTIDTVPSDFASNSGLLVRNYPIFGRNFTNATYYPLRNFAPAHGNDYPYNNTYWAGKPTTFTYVPYVGIIVENGDKITNCASMFYDNANFNDPDVGLWDMSTVTNMSSMFWANSSFNQDVSNWDTSSVTTMSYTFYQCSNFNQNIGGWNTGAVTNMESMLRECTNFNQDLSGWCVTNITSEPFQFSGSSSLSTSNKPGWGTCYALGGNSTQDISVSGTNYRVHTFTSSGTFTVRISGTFEYLIVAGGGAGGGYYYGTRYGGGGGGGGGLLTNIPGAQSGGNNNIVPTDGSAQLTLSPGTYSVVVGAGGVGAAGHTQGGQGGNSSFGTITAIGGGGGGTKAMNAGDGGSGGGGAPLQSSYYGPNQGHGGAGTAGQGNNGGGGVGGDERWGSSGGGGASAAGGGGGMYSAGAGGAGVSSDINGTATMYAGGGGGATGQFAGNAGLGGSGGGGRGTTYSGWGAGDHGTANTGGGGGGAQGNTYTSGLNGGSGIVIVRYTL